MDNLTIFAIGLFTISSLIFAFIFKYRLVCPETRKHLTYPMYAARDKLIRAVIEGKVHKDDPAFLNVYELMNFGLSVYKRITLRWFLFKPITKDMNEQMLNEIKLRKQLILSADSAIKEPLYEFMVAILFMLCKTSFLLRIILAIRPIIKRFSLQFPRPDVYDKYSKIESYGMELHPV